MSLSSDFEREIWATRRDSMIRDVRRFFRVISEAYNDLNIQPILPYNTALELPWPSVFYAFLHFLKFFLLNFITINF